MSRLPHPPPEDEAGHRLILGLGPSTTAFDCADCGQVTDPGEAAWAKVFVIDQVLRCEPRLYDLFLDPAFPAGIPETLREMGYLDGAAAAFIGSSRELGLLDDRDGVVGMGAARCKDCYLRLAEAFEARRGRETLA
jgi:hypothetical protein